MATLSEAELGQHEDAIIRGFLGLMMHQAKKLAEGKAPFNYFIIPDMLVQHMHPVTHDREVLVGGIPVLRMWRETHRGEVSVHTRLIVQDYKEFHN